MCDFQHIIRRKINNWKRKCSLSRVKSKSKPVKKTELIISSNSLRYCCFYRCERSPPSSNQGLILHEVPHIEDQTSKVMLEAFQRTLTPIDLSNDCNGMKIYWVELLWRGQLPLYSSDHGGFHIPKRLQQTLRSRKFRVTVDTDFQGTIDGCASTTGENHRDISWINVEIRRLMMELYHQGYAHSVEVWQNDRLVGGLYGVSLGAYFTIESQFSSVKDASKVALVHLVARLRLAGYQLLDIDEITSHLAQFGAYEIPRHLFFPRAKSAMTLSAIWLGNDISIDSIQQEIQHLTQSQRIIEPTYQTVTQL